MREGGARPNSADRVWHTRAQVELAIVEYVGWFNHARLHERLGDLPPAEFEALSAIPNDNQQEGGLMVVPSMTRLFEARLSSATVERAASCASCGPIVSVVVQRSV